MKKQDKKTTIKKNSLLLVIGMIFLAIGVNSVEDYVKYPLLVISLISLLYLMFDFGKEAKNQIINREKKL